MKIFKPIMLLLTLCLVLAPWGTLAFAADASVTMNCANTAKAGDTVTISGTAESDTSISIKVVDASGNIAYFDVVKTDSNGQYSDDFIVPDSLAGTTVTVVAGYGSNVATKALTISGSVIPTKTPPVLTADTTANTVGQAIDITFTDNSEWRGAISGVFIDESAASLASSQYTISSVDIKIVAGVFTTVGSHNIVVKATGYENAAVSQTINAATTGGGGDTTGGGGGSSDEGTANTTPTTNANTVAKNTITVTTTVAAPASSAGKASCAVTSAQVTTAITQAVADAAAKGANVMAAIEINVTADAGTKSLETSVPKASISEAADKGIAAMTVSSPIASITFDQKTLQGIVGAAGGDVKIAASDVAVSTLPESVQQEVGYRPVFNFSVTSGNSTISNFDGSVTVEVPYTPAGGEDSNAIVIYYVNASGNLEMVKDCSYDAVTGKIAFKTTHFSNYAVGYNKVNFSDVSGWYKDYVSYLSARGIITGTGSNKFAPSANITRAEFAQILANMSDADLSGYNSSSFSDVRSSDWYCKAVNWAYQNGVVLGSNGKYNPNANITRQDMAVMLDRYMEKISKTTLAQTVTAVNFADQSSISGYAKDAVGTIQQAGIISGRSDNTFDPKANATRAESSKMMALLMQSII